MALPRPAGGGGPSSADAVAAAIVAALASAGDPARAAPMAAYMRDRFAFLGLPAPLRRRLARPWITEARRAGDAVATLRLARRLWRERWRECHYVAVDLLATCATQLPGTALTDLERLSVTQSWWDTVVALAKHVAGVVVRVHPPAVATVERWAADPDPWLRRAAILHQLGARAATDRARLFRHCLANGGDPEFFIRKAIGWALRDYAGVDPDAVGAFLEAHRGALSPLSVREASRHLPPARAVPTRCRPGAKPAR